MRNRNFIPILTLACSLLAPRSLRAQIEPGAAAARLRNQVMTQIEGFLRPQNEADPPSTAATNSEGNMGATAPPDSVAADSSAAQTAGPDTSAAKSTFRSKSYTVQVQGHRLDLDRLGALSAAVQPTSVVTQETIARKNADDLAQAVLGQPGVNVLTACGSCGFKQIQINGLGAEHTTVLVDGLPLFSTVTGFYGVDALTTAGLADIEIARGPGASLLAPEAIGGAMDIRFRNPTRTAFTADAAGGNNDWSRLSFSGQTVADSGNLGLTVAGHHFQQGQWDADNNGVSESPALKDESGLVRLNGNLGNNWYWDLRGLHSYSEVYGAYVTDDHMYAGSAASDTNPGYVGGDVRNAYTGSPVDIIEWIQTGRDEGAGSLTWDSDYGLWALRAGAADQTQTSEYEGGEDYFNRDRSVIGDLRWQGTAGPHTVTLGADSHYEIMQSQSSYFLQQGVYPDAFEATFLGAYAQDNWNFGHQRDLTVAVRFDKATVDWFDIPNEAHPQIDDFIPAPRANFRWEIVEGLTGRLSAGVGWRAPLTFFESDHGILGSTGFNIGVDKLEKAGGFGASLSLDKPQYSATVSAYGTQVSNIAYVDESGAIPTLRNFDGDLPFLDLDAEASVSPVPQFKLGAGVQHQEIPDRYKGIEPVAAVETQIQGQTELDVGPAALTGDLTWTAPRDLTPYGYDGQYNTFDFATGTPSDPKLTHAPDFFVINARATYDLTHILQLYLGADNLFDYTQTGSEGDNPDFWDDGGGFGTSHIWGPLRGRQLYVGLRWKS